MSPSFTHDDVFPIIERLIQDLHEDKRDFVPHRLIAKMLLDDELGRGLVKEARRANQLDSDEKCASNMVAWFSKIFTERLPVSAEQFDRTKLRGRWAYKPKGSFSLAREAAKTSMERLQVFTFGYWGWGNATHQLIESLDAVEADRGFKPPILVDIRLHRSVRAAGFREDSFEKPLGAQRYRWMKSLGNLSIAETTGQRIKIKEPEAADDLLDVAMKAAIDNRRLIFFCGCEWPRENGKIYCHRAIVANLLIRAALERGVPIEILEWPGGEPIQIDLDVKSEVFAAVMRGKKTIALDKGAQRRPILAFLGPPSSHYDQTARLSERPVVPRNTCGTNGVCRCNASTLIRMRKSA